MNRRVLLIGGSFFLAAMGAVLLLINSSHRRGPAAGRGGQEAVENPVSKPADAARKAVPVHGYQARLRTANPLDLFEEWISLYSRGKSADAGAIGQALGELLRGNPHGNEEFYRRARRLLLDSETPLETKQELVRLLDRTATPAAAQLLLELGREDLPVGLRLPIHAAISSVGEYYWEKGFLPEASQMLFQAWQETRDPQMLDALAKAMAKAGNFDQLLDAALGAGKTLADIRKSEDPRVVAAWSALGNLQNPDVVPTIAEHLKGSAASSAETSVCAGVLASMGNIEATRALLSWAQGTGDSYASIVRDAFAKVQFWDSVEFLRSEMAQNPRFKSSLVQRAVSDALKRP